jgi:AMIN domain
MRCIFHQYFICLLMVAGAASQLSAMPSPAAKALATVESVKVTSTPNGINVEISTSQPIALRSQVTTEPDRLVLDFPGSVPAGDLHSRLLNQGQIKGFRVGRFSARPPTTRVVIDLLSPQHYQIFPDGTTVIVKLMSDEQQAAVRAQIHNVAYSPAPAIPVPTFAVEYQNGRLGIVAHKATLAEVLKEVQRQTGTDIPIPPGAGQEPIVTDISPRPIREALVSLLNGSRYNFILVDSEHEPGKLKSVILTYRGAGGVSQPAIPYPQAPVTESEPEPEPVPEVQPVQPEPQPEEGAGQQEGPPPQDNAPPQ